MWEMSEYIEAEKKTEKEASRTKAAPGSESVEGAAEEQSTRRTQQVVPKHPRVSASKSELSQKKKRKRSEAVASAQVSGIIPSGNILGVYEAGVLQS